MKNAGPLVNSAGIGPSEVHTLPEQCSQLAHAEAFPSPAVTSSPCKQNCFEAQISYSLLGMPQSPSPRLCTANDDSAKQLKTSVMDVVVNASCFLPADIQQAQVRSCLDSSICLPEE